MLLILDSNNLCMRAFHTQQANLMSKRGEVTGVIYGYLQTVKGLLEKFPETTKVVATWDFGHSKWRKALYPQYKGNRNYGDSPLEKAKFQRFKEQCNFLHEFISNLGIHSLRFKDYEADDIMYAICKMEPGNKIVVSTDKDMYQLINDEVSIYSPYKGKVIGKSDFYTEMGVSLRAYIGYRCLVGDPSDNIPGVAGIGEKTAKNLMEQYGHIDNMFQDKDVLMKSKRTAKIFDANNLTILGRNNKLMDFKYVNFEEIKDEMVETLSKELGINTKVIRETFIQKEFVSILANFISWISPFSVLGGE